MRIRVEIVTTYRAWLCILSLSLSLSLLQIEDGDINACINQKEQMIVFSDEVVDDDCAQTLEERLKECMSLQQEMSKASDQLSLNPRYVQKVRKLIILSNRNFLSKRHLWLDSALD